MPEENPYYRKIKQKDLKDISSLNKKEAGLEIKKLRDAIDYHDYRYYIKNDPVISDELYDILFRRLEKLEEKYPDFQDPNSPTKRVGAAPVDELASIKHRSPMLSLESAYERSEVEHFHDFIRREIGEDFSYSLEPKLDGLSIELVYEKGELSTGSTRGDGINGEDITRNLRTVRQIPLKLRTPEKAGDILSVRGELLLSKDGFRELNKQRIQDGSEPFANPRNAASGIVRQLDPKNVTGKPFIVYFYAVLETETDISSQEALFSFLEEVGLQTNPLISTVTDIKGMEEYWNDLNEKREELDYEIDGIVCKVNEYDLRERLGRRERNPRWAIAWKFPPKKEISRIEDIAVQVGRTGILTPVALLDPVNVGGVTVSRASLHNMDEVQKKDLRIGDKVRVLRAGDVIPEVAERITEDDEEERNPEFQMPSTCPSCGSEVVREGAYYFCTAGLSCPAQLSGRVIHFASKEALDIENLGDKTAEELVEKGMIKDLSDIYYLTKEDFLKLEGFAEKSASQLENAIEEAKTPPLDRFLYALGTRHLGRHIAGILAEKFGSLKAVMSARESDLESINEIGPEIASSVADFFHKKENRESIERMKKAGLKVQKHEEKGEKPLEGLTIVFTGELDNYSRNEAEDLVESLGARTTSSVSSNTDYLVAGENPGSKHQKARENKVKILSEKEFLDLINKGQI